MGSQNCSVHRDRHKARSRQAQSTSETGQERGFVYDLAEYLRDFGIRDVHTAQRPDGKLPFFTASDYAEREVLRVRNGVVQKETVMPKVRDTRPTLVQVGKHLIDPLDVASITNVRKDLYVVRLKSQPNAEFPCWVEEKHIGNLIAQFRIIEE